MDRLFTVAAVGLLVAGAVLMIAGQLGAAWLAAIVGTPCGALGALVSTARLQLWLAVAVFVGNVVVVVLCTAAFLDALQGVR